MPIVDLIINNGQLVAQYDDSIVELLQQLLDGVRPCFDRASRIEPIPEKLAFQVDLRPIGGQLYRWDPSTDKPFETREQAIAFERRYLRFWLQEIMELPPLPVAAAEMTGAALLKDEDHAGPLQEDK